MFSCSLFEHWDQEMLSGLEEEEQGGCSAALSVFIFHLYFH